MSDVRRKTIFFLASDICHLTSDLCFDDLVALARVPHPIHPELGRETPQRQWYFVSRRGRVGRCQVFQAEARCRNQNLSARSRSGSIPDLVSVIG